MPRTIAPCYMQSNSIPLIAALIAGCYYPAMPTIQDIRRQNFARLLAEYETNKAFADATGLPAAFVSQIKTGRRDIGEEVARKMERNLRLHHGYMDVSHNEPGVAEAGPSGNVARAATPIVAWETPEDLPQDQYVLVERRRVRPSAGEGALIFEEEQAPPLAFTTSWIKREGLKRHNLVIVGASGDSMEPTIHDGDSLMVNLGQREVVDGLVYVLRYGGELRIKRLFRRYDGALIVRSDNSAKYPEEVIPPEHLDGQVQVIGRVVWRAGGVS